MEPKLSGKVAIVTGAGQGLGRSEALFLASHGASVIVNDRGGLINGAPTPNSSANRVVNEIRAAGGRGSANFGDVSNWADAKAMVDQAIAEFGGLDIVVCNAGILRDRMVFNMSEPEWDAVIDVHLKGHFTLTHFAANHWRSQNKLTGRPADGRIIYTASEAGMWGSVGQPNYSAAKGGIMGLCMGVAKELERFGCTVNTISPRGRTPMTEGTFGALAAPDGGFDIWDPDNVAPWVGFLASDNAAKINGQIFVVYGGTVQLMQPWPTAATISQNRKWTFDELVNRARELFPEMSASPPSLDPSVMDYLGIPPVKAAQ